MNNSNSRQYGQNEYVHTTSYSGENSQDKKTSNYSRALQDPKSFFLIHNSSTQSSASNSGQDTLGDRKTSMPTNSRYRFQIPSPTSAFPQQLGDENKGRSASCALMKP